MVSSRRMLLIQAFAFMALAAVSVNAYTGTSEARGNPAFRSLRSQAGVKACSANQLRDFMTAIADHARVAANTRTLERIEKVFKDNYMENELKLLKLCGQAYHTPARLNTPDKKDELVKAIKDHSIAQALPGEVRTAIERSTANGAWPAAAVVVQSACDTTHLFTCLKFACNGNFGAATGGNAAFRDMDCVAA